MGFCRKEYWSGLLCPLPGDLPDAEIELMCLMSPEFTGTSTTREAQYINIRQPTPVFLPRRFHGQRNLADYSPWGHKESDTTERLFVVLSQVRPDGWVNTEHSVLVQP